MGVIRENNSVIVLINTFYVAPEKADELLDLLVQATT
jgi:heme-degrading monooxygenase HmoA